MAKLTDGQKEQARSMFEDGKKCIEIINFFKDTYKIKLNSSTLSYILHGRKKQGYKSSPKKRILRTPKKEILEPLESSDEFVSHVRAAFEIFKRTKFIEAVEAIINTK